MIGCKPPETVRHSPQNQAGFRGFMLGIQKTLAAKTAANATWADFVTMMNFCRPSRLHQCATEQGWQRNRQALRYPRTADTSRTSRRIPS